MKHQTDVAGRPFLDITYPEGAARLTMVPAAESRLGVATIRLEVRTPEGDFGPAIEVPNHAVAEVMAVALGLTTEVTTALASSPSPSPTPPRPSTGRLQLDLAKTEAHLPKDLNLQPSMADRVVYYADLSPHQVMRLSFLGARLQRGGPDAPPHHLRHVALRLEPDPQGLEGQARLRHFTLFDPTGLAGDYFSFYAEDLQVEFIGQT